jgi:galactokinase/mevalonate kinase-like predicted kinase
MNNSVDSELNQMGIKTLEFLKKHNIEIPSLSFLISSNIPKYAGLAGSAAIILNILLLLTDYLKLNLDFKTLAQFATLIEHEEMGIVAGPLDRFVITYGGAQYMDFTDPDYMKYEITAIDIDSLPFWIGVRSKNVNSGDMHRFAYNEYPHNPKLQEIVKRMKKIAIEGKELIEDRDVEQVGHLMNENQRLTSLYGKYGNPNKNVLLQREIDEEIFGLCRQHDTYGVKLAGSSGAIVVLSDEKPEFLLDFQPSNRINQQLDDDLQGRQVSSVVRLKAGNKRTPL